MAQVKKQLTELIGHTPLLELEFEGSDGKIVRSDCKNGSWVAKNAFSGDGITFQCGKHGGSSGYRK